MANEIRLPSAPAIRKIQDTTSEATETVFEFYSDAVLAAAFLATTIIAAKRISRSRSNVGSETTVVTAFYSLIFLTSLLRTVWFVIPGTVWSPYYTPHDVMAFDSDHPYWFSVFIEVLLLGAGSLCLFSIFILILVYWADILKKYFYPGARRSKPMITFLVLVAVLVAIQVLNATLFLFQKYSSESMILVNSLMLSLVSIICVCEITIFSHRFRTVLKTLGDINQVSTESQVKRIVWITVTGNLFFFTRAFLEASFAILLLSYWRHNGTVAEAFTHPIWDSYILLKHWSELAILGLMLYILQSRFASSRAHGASDSLHISKHGYDAVPESDLIEADGITEDHSPSTLSV